MSHVKIFFTLRASEIAPAACGIKHLHQCFIPQAVNTV